MLNAKTEHQQVADPVAIHRNAFNAAFYELGFKWHWCDDTYSEVLPVAQEGEYIKSYLERHHPHLLKAYDADFLINAIQTTKAKCYDAMVACGSKMAAFVNWAEIQKCEVGV